MIFRPLRFLVLLPLLVGALWAATPRETIAAEVLADSSVRQRELIASLVGQGDEAIAPLLTAWRQDALYIFTSPAGEKLPVTLSGEKDAAGARVALRVVDGQPLPGPDGAPLRLLASDLKAAEHTSALRRAMKSVLDVIDIAAPSPAIRKKAIQTLGQGQKPEYLPALEARLAIETDPAVALALREAVALTRLKSSEPVVQLSDKRHWKAGLLSHGEKQWLEIGMLLASEPRVLLVDEPAAGMTDEETHRTGELLLGLRGNLLHEGHVVLDDNDAVFPYTPVTAVFRPGRFKRSVSAPLVDELGPSHKH